MKMVILSLVVMTLTACGTAQGLVSGGSDGLGKDLKVVGGGFEKLANKIKPN